MEFALVLPMLLVLLLGIADFGRVFSAGITAEAAARNAAEAVAQEYVQIVRNSSSGALTADDYARIHDVAIEVACGDAVRLPFKAAPVGVSTLCERDDPGTSDPALVAVWPVVAVCVHDDVEPGCGTEASAQDVCSGMSGWSNANVGPAPSGSLPLPYVEVRACYQFTTLIDLTSLELPFGWGLAVPSIYLQKDREFAVSCYGDLTVECG